MRTGWSCVTWSLALALCAAACPACQEPGTSTGTAFIVGRGGYLLTCAHVVKGAAKIEVTVAGKTYAATVVRSEEELDLALLRAAIPDARPLPLADSESVEVGQEVRVFGFPLGPALGESVKATRGTISGIETRNGRQVLQIDAAVNPGNSGGPLVDQTGVVVGVVNAKITGPEVSNIGFAIPIGRARALLKAERVEPATADSAAKLDGPALVKQVSPALALVVAPQTAAPAGQAGDVITFFEVAPADGGPDVDIHGQRVTREGKCLWGEGPNGIEIASAEAVETAPAACEDGAGGAIVVYQYQFAGGEHKGDTDIVAQRIDRNGKALWNKGESPSPVGSSKAKETNPVVLSDGAGGAFIVYQWTGEDGDTDLLAQRIGREGKALWNEGKKASVVGASKGKESRPVLVPDGEGGLIVLFEWQDDKGDTDIMAQRLSGSGQELWNGGERATDVASTNALERHVAALSDGQGGAIAVYEFEPREGENQGDVDIMAQRLSGDGKLLWNEGKEPSVVSSSKGLERNPTVVPDGKGGLIVAFEFEPREGGNKGDVDIMAQRLDGDGKMLWNKGERSVMVSSGTAVEQGVRGVPLADGGAIFVFDVLFREGENAGDLDILTQRLDADGKLVWNEGERSAVVSSSKWRESGPIPLPDGEGGLIVILPAGGPPGEHEGDIDIEAMRLSGEGKLVWNNGERAVDVAAGKALERNPCAVSITAE